MLSTFFRLVHVLALVPKNCTKQSVEYATSVSSQHITTRNAVSALVFHRSVERFSSTRNISSRKFVPPQLGGSAEPEPWHRRSLMFAFFLLHSIVATLTYEKLLLYIQGSAKEWSLGCVIPASWPPLAAGARFTQPRDHSLADPYS